LITARLFLVPLIHALLGRPMSHEIPRTAHAAAPLAANGPRAHYMRATSHTAADGRVYVTPVRSQDSSLLSPLINADCLIIRPIGAPPLAMGATAPILPLDL
jgi:molybdopterin molybdotransferase